jgi:glycosyltransferase involved in cell wall biosynthesis
MFDSPADKPKSGQTRIRAYIADRAGCAFARIVNPLGHLARKYPDNYFVQVHNSIYTDHVHGNDIVVFERQFKPEVYTYAVKMKKAGAKIVYEIDDDLFNIPDWNPARNILGVKSVQNGIRMFLGLSDAMFVSTNRLAEVYGKFCKRIFVLPNSIDYDFFFSNVRNEGKKAVLWQGSMTHYKDISIMGDSLARIAKEKKYTLKMWCGFDLVTHKPIFDIPGSVVIPLVQFESFYPMFSLIDSHVGVAPLCAVPFNLGKSNLKFLEYTAQGIVTVASNYGPYKETIEHEKTGILISDNRDWYSAVMYLLEDDIKREEILKNAQEFVRDNYNIVANCDLWKTAIDELMGDKKAIGIS